MRREYLEIGLVITWKQLSLFFRKKRCWRTNLPLKSTLWWGKLVEKVYIDQIEEFVFIFLKL